MGRTHRLPQALRIKAAHDSAEQRLLEGVQLDQDAGLVKKAQPSSRRRAQHAHPVINISEILAAVESLYKDELKPFGRILRKRLSERSSLTTPDGLALPEVDSGRLRSRCQATTFLRVYPEEGGEWSVQLVSSKPTFVDVYSPVDVYPGELWSSASEYFASLDGDVAVLPGGRYSCAQTLSNRCLPFLAGLSLGRICHVVQLAISQKKILGYLTGAIVPYDRSQSMVKDRCASAKEPCLTKISGDSNETATADEDPVPFVSWENLNGLMQQLLDEVRSGEMGQLPLSNVKRVFRAKFELELSETFLGHSKLCDLLQDDRLSDVCEVRLRGNGYLVYPRVKLVHAGTSSPTVVSPSSSPFAKLGFSAAPMTMDGETASAEAPNGNLAGMPAESCYWEVPVQSSCFQLCPTDAPLNLGNDLSFLYGNPSLSETVTTGFASLGAPDSLSFFQYDACAAYTSWLDQHQSLTAMLGQDPSLLCAPCVPEPEQSPVFGPTPLVGEENRVEVRCSFFPQSSWKPALSPSTLLPDGPVGSVVRNTFIHAPLLPCTPLQGSQRRSQSAPRDMGSRKDEWEIACNTLGYLLSTVEGPRGLPIVGDTLSNHGSDEGASTACSLSEVQVGTSDMMGSSSESGLEIPLKAKFGADEPLDLEEEGVSSSPSSDAPSFSRLGLTLEKSDIRNTFIHVAGAQPSPLPGASRHRSHSLPRYPTYLSSPKSLAASPLHQDCSVQAFLSPTFTASPATPYYGSKLMYVSCEAALAPVLRLADHV